LEDRGAPIDRAIALAGTPCTGSSAGGEMRFNFLPGERGGGGVHEQRASGSNKGQIPVPFVFLESEHNLCGPWFNQGALNISQSQVGDHGPPRWAMPWVSAPSTL
jgi:hypothetical protein